MSKCIITIGPGLNRYMSTTFIKRVTESLTSKKLGVCRISAHKCEGGSQRGLGANQKSQSVSWTTLKTTLTPFWDILLLAMWWNHLILYVWSYLTLLKKKVCSVNSVSGPFFFSFPSLLLSHFKKGKGGKTEGKMRKCSKGFDLSVA